MPQLEQPPPSPSPAAFSRAPIFGSPSWPGGWSPPPVLGLGRASHGTRRDTAPSGPESMPVKPSLAVEETETLVCIRVRGARAWRYWDHCLLATGRGGAVHPQQRAESPTSPAGKAGPPTLLTLPGGTDLPPQSTSWGARLGTSQQRGATLPLALESL